MQKSQFFFILGLILAMIVAIFALTNANPVVVNLLFYKFEASLAIIIFLSAALGATIVISLGLKKQIKLIKEINLLRKSNEELLKQNKHLNYKADKIIFNDDKVEEEKDNGIDVEKTT